MYTCDGCPNLLGRNGPVKGDSRIMNTNVNGSTEDFRKNSGLRHLRLGMNGVSFRIKILKTTTVVGSRNTIILFSLDDVKNSLLGGVQ
jgi:hypothetical protein